MTDAPPADLAALGPRRGRDGHAMPIASSDVVTRPLKTSENVARDIVHDIVVDHLSSGDRLPSEAAMLIQYGVSRESLREALRLLEVQGLITLRRGPGGGPVVGNVDPADLGRTSALYYHLAGGTYDELFEAWVLTESLLAERAARNPDREAVRAAMEAFTDEGARHDDAGVAGFVAVHTHFHRVVASLAENRVLEIMLQTIGQIVTHHVVVNADPRDEREVILHDHSVVARAIAAGRANKASQTMGDHISHMVSYYQTRLGTQLQDYIDWR